MIAECADILAAKTRPTPDWRPLKITLAEMRATGVRSLRVYCADYRCGHNIKLEATDVDRWPDQVRLSELEPRFVCKVCGQKGALLQGGGEPTTIRIHPSSNRVRRRS